MQLKILQITEGSVSCFYFAGIVFVILFFYFVKWS